MPDVAFKDLCIDATDDGVSPGRVARFWGQVLGQEAVDQGDRSFRLEPPPGGPVERRIWINPVPERPTVKTRVHLDVRFAAVDVAALVSAGARLVREPDDDVRWHVLEDPDGTAWCAFGPHPQYPDASPGPFELVVDSADPAAIATWWAARTGGRVGGRPGASWVYLEGVAGFPFLFWVFTPVPEPKRVKNRVHWDVTLLDADVDGLVRAGATLLRAPDAEINWWVMADPEGNEFCAFVPRSSG